MTGFVCVRGVAKLLISMCLLAQLLAATENVSWLSSEQLTSAPHRPLSLKCIWSTDGALGCQKGLQERKSRMVNEMLYIKS